MIQYAPGMKIKQTGLRRKFRDLMDPVRSLYPNPRREYKHDGKTMRASALRHPTSWYLDGHLERRPINAAYAYAQFAEWCLAKVKAGKTRSDDALVSATVFFADTRRFLELIIRNTKAGVQFRKKDVDRYAPRVRQLCREANEIFSKIHR